VKIIELTCTATGQSPTKEMFPGGLTKMLIDWNSNWEDKKYACGQYEVNKKETQNPRVTPKIHT
jgi:hypothetical protein